MSEGLVPVRGVVFAHGQVAPALVSAVAEITGIRDALHPLSNTGMAPGVLADRLREVAGEGPTLIFTDLRSSSCSVVARRAADGGGRWAVLCGTNLPMLLDFVFHRTLSLEELVPRLVALGRDGVVAVPMPTFDGNRPDSR